ncbi:MAG: 50S ribosomal protein L18, partial [Candidatus Nealsonbacteria bacterium]
MEDKQTKRYRRHKRVRAKVRGTNQRPRFSVFRSNRHIYCQVIEDEKGKTLVSASALEIKKAKNKDLKKAKEKTMQGKVGLAYQVGQLIAKKAQKKGIK